MTQDINDKPEQIIREETNNFPCPSCGANMTFNPETQTLTCGYCSKSVEIAAKDGHIEEHDFFTAKDTSAGNWGSETRVMHCQNCGAGTVLDVFNTAQSCAFCGSAHVTKSIESAGIPPESLIPFLISFKKAAENYSKWLKGKFFAPRDVKIEHKAVRLNGVYVPFWTYDADTWSAYSGEAGEYYYETQNGWAKVNGKQQMVTKQVRQIRWRPTSGVYTEYFDEIPVNASKNIEENIINKLHNFDMKKLVLYKPEYLSGFQAERYGIGLEEGWLKARKKVDSEIYKGVIDQIRADEVRNLSINTICKTIKFKHVLLPVWISAFTYKKKIYRFMVNGQTGNVQGETPVSLLKVAGTMAAFILAFIIIYLIFKR
ncbi:MAG: hypothetical protein PHX37_00060 [Eubacteriales bacterium]|nr:hypothetical protein [Eubacteriales bacterium]